MLEKIIQEFDPKQRISRDVVASYDSAMEEASVDVELAALGELISPEQFLKRMELEQRLDAKIDRAVKRLLQLKTMKSIVGLVPRS